VLGGGMNFWNPTSDSHRQQYDSGDYKQDIFVVPFLPTEELQSSWDITGKNPSGVVSGPDPVYAGLECVDRAWGWATMRVPTTEEPNFFGKLCELDLVN
jgi:hypothetical protein